MIRKYLQFGVALGAVLAAFLIRPADTVLAQAQMSEYLCELGKTFYAQGKPEEALSEFNKALIIDPLNQRAKNYISEIFSKDMESAPLVSQPPVHSQAPVAPDAPLPAGKTPIRPIKAVFTKEEAMELALGGLQSHKFLTANLYNSDAGRAFYTGEAEEEVKGFKAGPLRVSGESQIAFGVTSKDFIWKRANFNLNERFKSYRMLSDAALDRRFNTYDPAIYDSLSVNLDTENEEGFNAHTNITVDPWSFVGKSDKVIVSGSNGDSAEVQLRYWSNTGYTLNNTVFTSLDGDTINLPELKVRDGVTDAATVISNRYNAIYNIPSMKIYREFQPLREFWLDYANDQVKFRVFPMAYQNQAYSSDDPLNITNHGIWWKDSKWLRRYAPGNLNTGDTPQSYTQGRWDDTFSFMSKDSTGKYLTALRGFAFSFQPQEETIFDTTIATPKDLWQDYGKVDNIISASRLKHYFAENLSLGGTFTSRHGFLTQQNQKLDSQNFVAGADLAYEIADGLKAQAEVLSSKSFYDMSNSDYKTQARGNAYYFSFITRYPQKSIMDLKYGYDEITKDAEEDCLLKSKFYISRMDKGFDSALSDFHNTRKDTFWSRHIHFRRPLEYFSEGMEGLSTNWDQLNSTRIGDGIDTGRNVLGFRFEYFLRDQFYNLFDVRNVHNVNGKFIENVFRDEAAIKLTDKLTAKVLGIYQKMPKTVGGVDPFVYDGNTGEYFLNAAVPDGEDPSLKTGSFGLNYDLFDWMSVNGIYERTNDYTIAYDDFPRNVLRNDSSLYGTFYRNDHLYRYIQPFLYSQALFPQAPYEFYNVFKCGLRLRPIQNMEIYLDYTRNEFETASIISDNINHVGIEVGYMPTKKMGMVFKYIFSRCQDLDRLQAGFTDLTNHHNFFSEFRYLPSKDDEFILQYGAGDTSLIGNLSSMDPYGGSMLTLDTQHIFRAYYRRRF